MLGRGLGARPLNTYLLGAGRWRSGNRGLRPSPRIADLSRRRPARNLVTLNVANWGPLNVANWGQRRGIQFVEHTEGDSREMFKAVCKLGLEGIVSKKVNAPYRSGPSKTWIKVKNPKAPAATRAIDGTF